MDYEVADAIDAAFDDNPTHFQDIVNNVLQNKAKERIEVEKVKVAQHFFQDAEEIETGDDNEEF
jgi:hypothetical protein